MRHPPNKMGRDGEVGWLSQQYVLIDAVENFVVIQQYDSDEWPRGVGRLIPAVKHFH